MPNDPALEGEILPDDRQLPAAPVLPAELYLLPLTEKPFFPAQTLPLLMNEAPWLSTVEAIGETAHHMVGLVVVKPDNTDDVKRADFRSVGTVVRMHHPVRTDGKMQFIAEGARRFRIVEWLSETAPYKVQVEYPNETGQAGFRGNPRLFHGHHQHHQGTAAAQPAVFRRAQVLPQPLQPERALAADRFRRQPDHRLQAGPAGGAGSLRPAKRMEKVLVLLKKELDVARLQSQIREQVEEKMTEQQREFFLREQLKAIQKELGLAKDDKTAEIDSFNERIAKLTLPEAAKKRIDEEMEKLSLLEPARRNTPSPATTSTG